MNALFLFENTRGVIQAESRCRSLGLTVDVISVPREISSECGMCLSVSSDQVAATEDVLTQARITYQLHTKSDRVDFDLLTTVASGGCSAKLPAELLQRVLAGLQPIEDARLLVGADTCDDAGIVRLSDDRALIFTTDFFPPVCSDPYDFGQIAAANAMSDVFAMGGHVLTAMNLVMFPAEGIPFDVLTSILAGGQDKVTEAGGLMVGGHTIADSPPKYGLAVTGEVHPEQVMTNANGRPGDALILTKPLGTGVLVAGHRLKATSTDDYRRALDVMKQLNQEAAGLANQHGIRCATDVTGFGLLGHALHIARQSNVTIEIDSHALPRLPGAHDLLNTGCIPGAAFRNQTYVEPHTRFDDSIEYECKMLTLDPQTSGGLLLTASPKVSTELVRELRQAGYESAGVIGRLKSRGNELIEVAR